jgi:tRNA synthetases class I (W and Y)
MSLQDGTSKMSKSDPNEASRINLTDTADGTQNALFTIYILVVHVIKKSYFIITQYDTTLKAVCADRAAIVSGSSFKLIRIAHTYL